jgi:hypothetical protein
MLFKNKEKVAVSGPDFAAVSALTSIYILFIVLSFREYFFFIPNFSRPYPIIAFVQVLTALGWISLIALPPIALMNWSRLGRFGPILLLVGALIWPVSTLMIKALYLSFYGNPFIGYIGDHPLFLLMEYGIPALYLYIWKQKRSQI